MKRLFLYFHELRRMLTLALFLCCANVVFADDECDFTVNNIHYVFLPNKTNEVAVSYREYESGRYGGYYSSYTGYVTIPAAVVYNGTTYKVTAVNHGAFAESYSLTSVTLPNTITSIGSYAFGDCGQLTSVNIPQTVKSIGASAFNGCIKLNSVTIPNGVTTIENSTFKDCQSLTYISLPSGVTSIGMQAFSGCSNLSSILIPNGVTSVGTSAFYGTPWLNNQPDGLLYIGKVAYWYKGTMPEDTEIVLMDGTTEISANAFSGKSGLSKITIPNSVNSIGASAFSSCTGLTAITLPESIETVGSSVFYGCSGLKDVTILCSSTGSSLFSNLPSLENVTFGNALTSIGSSTFYGCSALTSIDIPANVASIGNSAFAYCSNLASVSIANDQAYVSSSAFNGTPWFENQQDGLIYIGKVAYRYKGEMQEGTQIDIKEGTVAIGDDVFNGRSGLCAINIPNSVERIGMNALYGCTGLSTIILPEGLKTIDRSAFQGCSGLTSINLPNSLTSIEQYAFAGCRGLKSAIISGNNVIIGSAAFNNCSSIISVTIKEGVTGIGSSAFNGCSNLESVALPEGMISIGDYAFQTCGKLTSVILPKSLTSIGQSCFNTTGLLSITIPGKVTNIGKEAFCNTSLTSVIVEMTEPVSVTSSTFSYYSNYSYISFANNITLYVPSGSKSAYEAALVWKDFKEIVEIVMPTDISELTDAIYTEPATGLKGSDGTLTICLKNAQPTNAYSFDLVLPEGVMVESYTLSNRHNGHSETMNRNETAGVYSFAVLSLQSKEITGNDGAIWTLKLNVADDVAVGNYAVRIQNAKYSLTSGSAKVNMPETTSLLTIEDYVKGDVNGDTDIDIADAVCIVNYVVGKPTPAFVLKAADANGDGDVDIADAVRIVNLIVGKISALARQHVISLPEPE